MEKNSELYDFTQNLQGTIFYSAFVSHVSDEDKQAWQDRPAIMNIRRGYAESPGWMMVQALEFAPEPLSVERFRRRAVYSAPKLSLAMLELLASEKYLDRIGDDYHLTEMGQAAADKNEIFRVKAFEGFEPILIAEIEQLEALMRKIIDASLEADNLADRWCISHSRNRAPSEDVSALAKIIQYGADFNAIRDDAHMAAYGSHDVNGHVWEAFSFIANNQAKSAADLYEQLAYRGFYTEDWQAALDELIENGWLMKNDSEYAVTDMGNSVKADVGEKTDAYFFASWSILSNTEYDELIMIMKQLNAACQALIPQS
jgi:Helix-turn-helix family